MNKDWFSDAVRGFCFLLDKGVYWLVEVSYNLIYKISNVQILSQDSIESFASRIYVLLGVFMLFKISISLINMFLNPDSFNDAKSGGGKLVQRIIVSLLLLVVTPFVFDMAFELQKIILKENVLATIVLGGGDAEQTNNRKDTFENAGRVLSVTIFRSFMQPDIKGSETVQGSDGKTYIKYRYMKNQKVAEIYNADPTRGNVSINDYEDVYKAGDGMFPTRYYFDYHCLVSLVAGILAAWIMVMFCFDVAVRSVKLSFLQLIAPIPIVSYMDTKKGDRIFNSWVSNCISTYLDLFVRLLAIYFVIYVISELMSNGGLFSYYTYDEKGMLVSGQGDFWVGTFIVLGLLLFAKEVPNLVADILGVKFKGGFSLNPMKKLAAVPLVGKAASTVVGGIDSMANGKGFRSGALQGFNKIPVGGGENASILGAAENTKERIMQKLSGQQAANRFKEQEKRGEKAAKKQQEIASQPGKDKADIFKSEEFKGSYRKVENAKVAAIEANNKLSAVQTEYAAMSTAFEQTRAKCTVVELKGASALAELKKAEVKDTTLKAKLKQATSVEEKKRINTEIEANSKKITSLKTELKPIIDVKSTAAELKDAEVKEATLKAQLKQATSVEERTHINEKIEANLERKTSLQTKLNKITEAANLTVESVTKIDNVSDQQIMVESKLTEVQTATKDAKSAEGRHEYAKKIHEVQRQKHQGDAEKEEQIEYYEKYVKKPESGGTPTSSYRDVIPQGDIPDHGGGPHHH